MLPIVSFAASFEHPESARLTATCQMRNLIEFPSGAIRRFEIRACDLRAIITHLHADWRETTLW
jgi:hypothetical protein